jgi:hypothetical protein
MAVLPVNAKTKDLFEMEERAGKKIFGSKNEHIPYCSHQERKRENVRSGDGSIFHFFHTVSEFEKFLFEDCNASVKLRL